MVILLLCGGFSFSSHLSAQQPTFRARTDLVQVDVVVVDKDGNHVRGLKKEDFQLFDRRKPRPISAFDEVQHAAPGEPGAAPAFPPTLQMDVASNTDPQADRLVVMVIDDLHIYKGRTTQARELAHKFLDRMGARASMAVLKTSGARSTEITQDRALLTGAIDNFAGMQSWRRPHQAIDAQRAAGISPEAPLEVTLASIDKAQKTDLHDFFDNMTLFKTLRDASRMLATESVRRKAFVMITEGLGKDYVGRFDTNLTDCERTAQPCFHDQELRIMMESLRRSGVAVYNVDPRGKVEPGEMSLEVFPDLSTGLGDDPGADPFRWNNVVRLAQNGLRLMSEASGGFAITDSDDFDSGLDRIVEDLDHFYLLGFNPVDAEGSTGFRALDVRVPAHPEWTLRFRKGYLVNDIKPKSKTPLAALAEGVMPRNDLPLRLGATPRADRLTIALEVRLPKAGVTLLDGRVQDSLRFTVYAIDLKTRKIAAQFSNTAELASGPAPLPRGEDVAFVIPVEMRVKPGRYQLRASVTSTRVDKGGSVYLTIDVPDYQKMPLAISGLLVGRGGAEVALASTKVQLPFAPSVDREFAAAEPMQLYFDVITTSQSAPAIARVEVLSASGDVLRSSAPVLPSNGHVNMPVATAGLAPGAYLLRAVVTQGANSATRDTGFVVK
ncbi:MAG TPA: VWA domain-containing protein [Vicinamibacterales bacterium]|nr:VWA domain-containing protein [Vicinamibacterales bacterium]